MRSQKFRPNPCSAAGILNIMKSASLITIVSLTAVLLGCGQKGPLVLPDKQKPKRTIPSTAKPIPKQTPPNTPDPATGNSSSATGTPPGTPAPSTTPTP
jgi:predicted small lipoprotein YifL